MTATDGGEGFSVLSQEVKAREWGVNGHTGPLGTLEAGQRFFLFSDGPKSAIVKIGRCFFVVEGKGASVVKADAKAAEQKP